MYRKISGRMRSDLLIGFELAASTEVWEHACLQVYKLLADMMCQDKY